MQLSLWLRVHFAVYRSVARDIGGSDPERMAAPRVAEYVQSLFEGSCVSVNVVAEMTDIEREFPLLGAVNRATRGKCTNIYGFFLNSPPKE